MRCFIAFIISLLLINSAYSSVNEQLINNQWVYFALGKLETDGITCPYFASSKPIGRNEIIRIIKNIRARIEKGEVKPSSFNLKLIEKLEKEFVQTNKFDFNGRLTSEIEYSDSKINLNLPPKLHSPDRFSLSFWGSAIFCPTKNITLYEEIDIARDRELKGNQGYTASSWLDEWKWKYTADFSRAYIYFSKNRYELLLGRQQLSWGSGYYGNLVLSDNSPPFDMLFASAIFGPVKFITFSTELDRIWHEHGVIGSETDPFYRYLANRYLSGHRIDWIINKRIEMGLSEMILYGGEARNMELRYVNPLIPYYASQYNSKLDDNVLISFDLAVRPSDGIKLYGELLIDDLNYAKAYDYEVNHPSSLGYIVGIYLSEPISFTALDFRTEYTKVDTWTYSHRVDENQYLHYGWIIGHKMGPDAEQIFFEINKIFNVDTRLKIKYAYRRWGKEMAYWGTKENYYEKKFPSGKVSYLSIFGMQFLMETINGPQIDVSWNYYKGGLDKYPEYEISLKLGYLIR